MFLIKEGLPIIYQVLSAMALILSVGGNILINLKKKLGFVVWMISNSIWVAVNLISIQINWFQITMFVVFIGLNLHGLINWKKSMPSDDSTVKGMDVDN